MATEAVIGVEERGRGDFTCAPDDVIAGLVVQASALALLASGVVSVATVMGILAVLVLARPSDVASVASIVSCRALDEELGLAKGGDEVVAAGAGGLAVALVLAFIEAARAAATTRLGIGLGAAGEGCPRSPAMAAVTSRGGNT